MLVRKVSDNFRKYRLIKENEIIFPDMCGCHGNAWRSSYKNPWTEYNHRFEINHLCEFGPMSMTCKLLHELTLSQL